MEVGFFFMRKIKDIISQDHGGSIESFCKAYKLGYERDRAKVHYWVRKDAYLIDGHAYHKGVCLK